jgi:hypothetical protein
MFEIGLNGTPYSNGTETVEGVTDASIDLGIPLQKLQDTISKQGFVEPYLEGKYDIKGSFTISRHKNQNYQIYRDNQTPLHARISMTNGFMMQEVLIKNFKLNTAGADDSEVAMEPIEMDIQLDCETNDFSSWIEDAEIYQSPFVIRLRNSDPKTYITNR